MKFQRNEISKILITVMAGALCAQSAWATTFSNIKDEVSADSIVRVPYNGVYHDELHLGSQLNNYNYEVILDNAITAPFHLYFAYTQDQNVFGNTLIWEKGDIGSMTSPTDVYIFAGYSQVGTVSNNSLTLEGGSFYTVSNPVDYPYEDVETFGKIAAGKSDNGNLANNTVVVKGGNYFGGIELIGAYSNDQSMNHQQSTDNQVVIEGQTDGLTFQTINDVAPSVYGAKMHTADVAGNSVTMKNVTHSDSTFNRIFGAEAVNGKVSGNSVQILGSNFSVNEINGGRHGFDEYGDNQYINAENNHVYIEDSTIKFTEIFGTRNESGGVTGSSVKIVNSQLIGTDFAVISGAGSDASEESLSNNLVHLVDVKIDAGEAESVQVIASGHFLESGEVFDNRIIIESANDENHLNDLHQVMFMGADTYGDFHDNHLTVRRWKGAVGSISKFDSITFENFLWEKDGTVLEVKDEASIATTQLTVNAESIRFEDESLETHFGEQMALIKGEGIEFNPAYDNGQTVVIPSSLTEDSKGIIQNNPENNSVDFKLEGTIPSRQLELVSNNRNMGLFFVNHGAELILDNLDATNRDYHWGWRTFASIDGVQSNYSTKGHIDVHGFTAAAGLANSMMVGDNPLLINLFVETGKGDYTEEMSYLNVDRRFSGDVKYHGGGLSMRIKNQNGWYAEGSLRAGKMETDVSHGLIDGNGVSHGYNLSTSYYGAHIGAGRVFDFDSGVKLDVFAKYFYTYLPSESEEIIADRDTYRFNFDSVGSSRVRAGGRVYFPVQESIWAYTGLAYQYDFTPDVDVKVDGEEIANGASMRGSMGIGSLGVRYKSDHSPWVLDLKIRGYVGQREGVSGKAQAEYRF